MSLIVGIMIGSGIFMMAGSIALRIDSLAAVVAVWAFGGVFRDRPDAHRGQIPATRSWLLTRE